VATRVSCPLAGPASARMMMNAGVGVVDIENQSDGNGVLSRNKCGPGPVIRATQAGVLLTLKSSMRIAFLLAAAVAFWACTGPQQTNTSAAPEDPIDTKIKRNLEYLQAEPDIPNVDVKVKKEAKPAAPPESAKAGKSDENSSQASPATSTDRAQGVTK